MRVLRVRIEDIDLELRNRFDAMLERELRVELTRQPEWLRSNFAQSIKRMPVELTSGA